MFVRIYTGDDKEAVGARDSVSGEGWYTCQDDSNQHHCTLYLDEDISN